MAKKHKGDFEVENILSLPAVTADRATQINSSGEVESSATTTTELGHLSGVTSGVQSQIDSKIPNAEKGAANGVATLDGSGKIPSSQLTVEIYQLLGNWNATTNSPALTDGTGTTGDAYFVNVAGSQDLGSGSITYSIGDHVYYANGIWHKADNNDDVVSVAGKTGAVTLDTDDVTEATNLYYTEGRFDTSLSGKDTADLAEGTNLYHTDERSQDSIGSILLDTASIDFTYDDVTPNISADVLPAGVDHDSLNNYDANDHIDHSTVNINTNANSGLTGGGNITTSRSLSVDITSQTSKGSPVDTDEILIWDGAIKKASRSAFVGSPGASAGDINETAFAGAESASGAAVTGFAFANGVVRSFKALVHIEIDATADLFETIELQGIQKGASWDISVTGGSGDDSLVSFDISAAGQITYTSSTYAGFVSMDITFRAWVTSI